MFFTVKIHSNTLRVFHIIFSYHKQIIFSSLVCVNCIEVAENIENTKYNKGSTENSNSIMKMHLPKTPSLL